MSARGDGEGTGFWAERFAAHVDCDDCPTPAAVSELFLELLGIDSLDRLPDLAPLLPEVDSIDEEF